MTIQTGDLSTAEGDGQEQKRSKCGWELKYNEEIAGNMSGDYLIGSI